MTYPRPTSKNSASKVPALVQNLVMKKFSGRVEEIPDLHNEYVRNDHVIYFETLMLLDLSLQRLCRIDCYFFVFTKL